MKRQLEPLTGVRPRSPLVVAAALVGGALWAYGPALGRMAERWQEDPLYSHGYLVPAFAGVLLWLRRDRLTTAAPAGSGWGLLILPGAAALRLLGAYFFITWLEDVSFLVCLAGVVVLLGAGVAWRWAWPALAFLTFMLPLPHRVQAALSQPLQRVATRASTYCLQTLGLPAVAEGNVISLGELNIGIVEACNGLSMLIVFCALSTAAALLVRRPAWQRAALILSALPVAVGTNTVRIVLTAMLLSATGGAFAESIHDGLGWLMMPLAVGLLWGESALLARVLLEPEPRRSRLTRPEMVPC